MLVAVVVLLAGCGGGVVEDALGLPDAGVVTTATSRSDDSGGSAGAIEDQTFTVGQHFWHSGFRVDVLDGAITTTEDQLSNRVTRVLSLTAALENTGLDTGFFGPPLTVVTATNSYPASLLSDVPDVPGGLKGQASFDFKIDEGFDLASAELVVGDSRDNQARVPLSGGGESVRLEPRNLAIAGTMTMELIDLSFTSAALRYDIPDRHRQVEVGKLALTLNFDALSRKGGNWQLFAADFALILPDGTAIAPDAIEIGSLPGSDAGVSTQDRYLQFLVDEGAAGDYTLRLTPGSWFIGEDGVTEATFSFAIE
jgi:hypothetical protein